VDEPVSVRIARFIGWSNVQKLEGREKWVGIRPDWICTCGAPQEAEPRANFGCLCWGYEPIPDFEHDWSATGPLLARFRIDILHAGPFLPYAYARNERGWCDKQRPDEADILPAVCRVLLALAQRNEGKG
jgi:hypothetical protein